MPSIDATDVTTDITATPEWSALREHYAAFRELVAHEAPGVIQLQDRLKRPVFEDAGSLSDHWADVLANYCRTDDLP